MTLWFRYGLLGIELELGCMLGTLKVPASCRQPRVFYGENVYGISFFGAGQFSEGKSEGLLIVFFYFCKFKTGIWPLSVILSISI